MIQGVVDPHYCGKCVFYRCSMNACSYMLIMDIRRGCPAGAGCDKRMTKKEWIALGIPKAWDKGLGKRLFLEGLGDCEIAKRCGVTQGTISYYRKKHWETEVGENAECRVQNAECDASDGSACGDAVGVGETSCLPGTGNPSPTAFHGDAAVLAVPPPREELPEVECCVKEKQEDAKMPENETVQSNDGVSREDYNQMVKWMVAEQKRADEAEANVRKLEKVIARMAVAMYGGE